MEISIRDSIQNERGQGIIEYVLLLVVIVAMVFGGIYQLNTAFKSWANNYFGEYLACLLETGELPAISGSPGDSGICNEMFKAFSLADGRPLKTGASANSDGGSEGDGGGAKEERGGGGGGGTTTRVGRIGSNFFSRGRGGGRSGRFAGSGENLGKSGDKAQAGDYGGGYSRLNRRIDTGIRYRLDNRFAFNKPIEDNKSSGRTVSSVKVPEGAERKKKTVLRLNPDKLKDDQIEAPESEMTFGNFMRILIIAAIIIALVMVIGGQMLQIGKSMDN